MTDITTETIKALRDRTGISVMQCKKALEEAGGDAEKALVILSKRGAALAEKKRDRTLGSGTIASYIHAGGTVGAMVELSCETDFVAKNDEFKKLAYELAMHVAASDPEFLREEDVTESAILKAMEVFRADVSGMSKDKQETILAGKRAAFLKERVLMTQGYIKDPETTIVKLVNDAVQKFGERIEISRFTRFSIA